MTENSSYLFKSSDKDPLKEATGRRQPSLFVKVLAIIIVLLLVVVGVVVGVIVSRNKHQDSATPPSPSSSSPDPLSGGTSTNSSNDPSVFEKDPKLHKSFYGMAYTPEGSMLPNCSNSLDNVIKDIQASLWSPCSADFAEPRLSIAPLTINHSPIKQTKVEMEVFVGIYVSPDDNESYIRQRDTIKEAIQIYGVDHIAGVTVGNEFMLNYITSKQESDPNSAIGNEGAAMLIPLIEDTRNMLADLSLPKSMPVGNSDAGSYFNTKVLSSVDYGVGSNLRWMTVDTESLWSTSYPMSTLGLPK
ncbi:hypothetical protein C0992_004616 [Termitomyces sp. T32_za158]|nr:hypothetical protein C0992_004616 [Termitomyces sp. T32_za158]